MSVDRGHMVLHDAFVPPLKQGRYVVEVSTTAAGLEPPLPSDQRHFDVVGPRFGLAPADVAGCYPPKDAKGPFMDALPHVALGRRTLPWEILLDPKGRLPAPPPRRPGEPDEPAGEPPWMALLLLEETEIVAVKPNRKLSDVLPRDVLADLGAAPDTQVTSLAVDRDVLFDVLPTVEEMKLLTHVREVNVDDRELSAGDSDGFFAVVMSNRVPVAGRKYRACLVSLEGRSDVLRNDDPEVERTTPLHLGVAGEAALLEGRVPPVAASAVGRVAEPLVAARPAALAPAGLLVAPRAVPGLEFLPPAVLRLLPVELVLLASWSFSCEGAGTFAGLCERLDSRMFGDVDGPFPVVADTGHLALELRDRAGSARRAWYRGPLVPFPLTRDAGGPYHTADDCRRVSLETGMEDVTYAAAFEVGRLLAASDARFAQELMRWRRTDCRRSVERAVVSHLRDRLPGLTDRPELLLAGIAAGIARSFAAPSLPRVDPLELATLGDAAGLRAEALAAAWGLTPAAAHALLGGGPEALAPAVALVHTPAAGEVSLASVARDAAGLHQLVSTRGTVAAFQAGVLAGVTRGGPL